MMDPMDPDFDSPSLEASLDDLKTIYRVLETHREEHPELVANAFFTSLERLLEAQATVEGVDVHDDAEWNAWLADVEAPVEDAPKILN